MGAESGDVVPGVEAHVFDVFDFAAFGALGVFSSEGLELALAVFVKLRPEALLTSGGVAVLRAGAAPKLGMGFAFLTEGALFGVEIGREAGNGGHIDKPPVNHKCGCLGISTLGVL